MTTRATFGASICRDIGATGSSVSGLLMCRLRFGLAGLCLAILRRVLHLCLTRTWRGHRRGVRGTVRGAVGRVLRGHGTVEFVRLDDLVLGLATLRAWFRAFDLHLEALVHRSRVFYGHLAWVSLVRVRRAVHAGDLLLAASTTYASNRRVCSRVTIATVSLRARARIRRPRGRGKLTVARRGGVTAACWVQMISRRCCRGRRWSHACPRTQFLVPRLLCNVKTQNHSLTQYTQHQFLITNF